ncbi:ABC transporter ATP-binding protein [Glycomyces sp. NRRL B-16210]|uniref:ABC transporter ATP-binding protein n=1 Tax=Glycomyces sp. NRRL B-16210 TaxID=1463821 RepID=UPI0004C1CA86|nr:ABC transporter ATP-binding protein [Glycomyces sp. NRRL B-16210]
MSADTELLRTEGLAKTFGRGCEEVRAVAGVDLALRRGEITALVGQSGSGKSTLGRLLLRLLDPTEGRVLFDGQDVTAVRGSARRDYWREVQAVFQDPFAAFHQYRRVEATLATALRLLPAATRADGRPLMEAALAAVGLDAAETLAKRPHELSGGQRQRVMLARALMLRPRLLIADEATSMLDASVRVTVLNLLADLRDEQGMTVLFVTHDLGQAYYLADRIAVMHRGAIVESGPAERVVASPEHEYTRSLLADVPKLHRSG